MLHKIRCELVSELVLLNCLCYQNTLRVYSGVREEGRKVELRLQHFTPFWASWNPLSVLCSWLVVVHAAGQFVLFLQLFPIGGEERCEDCWPIRDIIHSQICHEPQTFPVEKEITAQIVMMIIARWATGEDRESVSLSIEILPGDYWSIDYAKWYSKTDRRWMLRKQNNLLSHWLNNQSATVLVSACSPSVTCCVCLTWAQPATSLWEFTVRLSSLWRPWL